MNYLYTLSPHRKLEAGLIDHTAGRRALAVFVGNQALVLDEAADTVNSLAWSADSTHLLAAHDDGRLSVWQIEMRGGVLRGTPRFQVQAHTGAATRAAFSPNGEAVASGGEDGVVRVWALDSSVLETGALLKTLCGNQRAIRDLDWSTDGTQLLAASDDGSVCWWQV